MLYKSTRDPRVRLSAAGVISRGISEEGGLFVPEALPSLENELPGLSSLSYRELAKRIFSCFLTDFSDEEISSCVEKAYAAGKFSGEEPVRLVPLTVNGENKYLLELWHGPSCAFKDMALQVLPRLLTAAMPRAANGREVLILTATSGDTGKAALEGFKDVPGVKIIVFYPQNGVSRMQKLQMQTQEGGNVFVCAIDGNFDDAQAAVKKILTDPGMKKALDERGFMLSSANSINWGRLLPQVVYYFYAYFELLRIGAVKRMGEKINIAVPTGNFGNILAAYYAKQMGLPAAKLICASNKNNVLTDFINTGVYDKRRDFYTTSSPSMDILVSSNLERLLFSLSGEDCNEVSRLMNELGTVGVYAVSDRIKAAVAESFFGGYCDEAATVKTIRKALLEENYLADTHTAVAIDVYRQYAAETGDSFTPTVIASTASPYKFAKSVLGAVSDNVPEDEFEAAHKLSELSKTRVPQALSGLKDKAVRFEDLISKDGAGGYVLRCARSVSPGGRETGG